jgi:hypothetical protein
LYFRARAFLNGGGDYQTAEFEIEARFVSHVRSYGVCYSLASELGRLIRFGWQIVGKGGAGVNKLREDLGVRIDFTDGQAAEPADRGKKRSRPRSSVSIKGRRENVEEAKKRVLTQVDKLVSWSWVGPQPVMGCDFD